MIPFSFVNTRLFSPLDLLEVWQVHCMGRFSTQAGCPKTMGTRVGPNKNHPPLPIFPYEIEGHWDPLSKKMGGSRNLELPRASQGAL